MVEGGGRLIYPQAVRRGAFVSRPNRFLLECILERRRLKAYLPNPGRLRELLLPGRTVLLTPGGSVEGRKTAWTAAGVMRGGESIMLHTHYTNRAVRWLLEERLVPGLEDWTVARSEVPHGRSRFDFLLRRSGEQMLVEVKSCTLFEGPLSMFPDAVTERGRRHVLELAALGRKGVRTCVLFVVQSGKARSFLPDYHTDPAFSRALYESREDLLIKAVGVRWDRNLSLSRRVRELALPWPLYEREARGGGSYLVVLHLDRSRSIAVGRLGRIAFERGYYVYVGSGGRSLRLRVDRHRRGGARRQWHIDYLRDAAAFREALPFRTADRLECDLAGALRKAADAVVEGFGSSDCRCRSHLFYMSGDPMLDEAFVDTVMHNRMGRLAEPAGNTGPSTPPPFNRSPD